MPHPYFSGMPNLPRTLNAAAAATTGTAIAITTQRFSNTYIKWDANVSGGSVNVLYSDGTGYAGNWPVLQTVTFNAARQGPNGYEDIVEVLQPHGAVRADVVSITGGTVTAEVQAWY